jgi:hypothetical protein
MRELDVVELVRAVPGEDVAEWPAGSRGTLLAKRETQALVELGPAEDPTETVWVPLAALTAG